MQDIEKFRELLEKALSDIEYYINEQYFNGYKILIRFSIINIEPHSNKSGGFIVIIKENDQHPYKFCFDFISNRRDSCWGKIKVTYISREDKTDYDEELIGDDYIKFRFEIRMQLDTNTVKTYEMITNYSNIMER